MYIFDTHNLFNLSDRPVHEYYKASEYDQKIPKLAFYVFHFDFRE